MIVTKLEGGLGNQLFQYAFGRCLAYKLNTELKLDITECKPDSTSHHSQYKLGNFNVQENFAESVDYRPFPLVKQAWNDAWVFIPEFFNVSNDIALEGWWQSEKYFIEIEDIIRKEFTLKNPLHKTSAYWKEKIMSSKCPVSLHVRHGDYLKYGIRYNHRLLSAEYYAKCINKLEENVKDITVFVFSDDMQWCRENLKLSVHMEFVENCEQSFEEIYLMSLCKHNIISQSTFAWWGAWLNRNHDKKVLAPYPWHMIEPYGKDIISENWIKVPIENPLYMPPMNSLIIYVDDDLPATNISLSSVLTQKLPDYEIIFIYSSNDAIGKVLRQISVNENVTLLKVDESSNKLFSWNKGLEVARGDYVMFLTGKALLFSNANNILSSSCNESLEKYANSKEVYMTYNIYGKYTPNIICSILSIEEDVNGTINLNGIPDKKFSVKEDSAFQGLNTIAEMNLSAQQKLMALGSNGINGLVGTKFFKRKFLNENNIRFNESEGVDSELAFVVNAFMATEKITFVPQLFYGWLKKD